MRCIVISIFSRLCFVVLMLRFLLYKNPGCMHDVIFALFLPDNIKMQYTVKKAEKERPFETIIPLERAVEYIEALNENIGFK